jgi:hypothetical protein
MWNRESIQSDETTVKHWNFYLSDFRMGVACFSENQGNTALLAKMNVFTNQNDHI